MTEQTQAQATNSVHIVEDENKKIMRQFKNVPALEGYTAFKNQASKDGVVDMASHWAVASRLGGIPEWDYLKEFLQAMRFVSLTTIPATDKTLKSVEMTWHPRRDVCIADASYGDMMRVLHATGLAMRTNTDAIPRVSQHAHYFNTALYRAMMANEARAFIYILERALKETPNNDNRNLFGMVDRELQVSKGDVTVYNSAAAYRKFINSVLNNQISNNTNHITMAGEQIDALVREGAEPILVSMVAEARQRIIVESVAAMQDASADRNAGVFIRCNEGSFEYHVLVDCADPVKELIESKSENGKEVTLSIKEMHEFIEKVRNLEATEEAIATSRNAMAATDSTVSATMPSAMSLVPFGYYDYAAGLQQGQPSEEMSDKLRVNYRDRMLHEMRQLPFGGNPNDGMPRYVMATPQQRDRMYDVDGSNGDVLIGGVVTPRLTPGQY